MTTMFRKSSAVHPIAALACFTPQLSFAKDKLAPIVMETKPKLTAGQFIANCQQIGGTVTDQGSSSGGHSISCEKDNGLNVGCDFASNAPAYCTGTGPRPQ